MAASWRARSPTWSEAGPRMAPFVCSVVFACVTMGVALATTIALIVGKVLSPMEAALYGWRIAFIVGGLMGLAGYWLRRSFEESPEFVELKQLAAASTEPTGELIRTHTGQVVGGHRGAGGDGGICRAFLRLYARVSDDRGAIRRADGGARANLRCDAARDDDSRGRLDREPVRAASAAPWRGCRAGAWGVSVLRRARRPQRQPVAADDARGGRRCAAQRDVRLRDRRLLSDSHPLQWRRRRAEHQPDRVRRHGAAGGDGTGPRSRGRPRRQRWSWSSVG